MGLTLPPAVEASLALPPPLPVEVYYLWAWFLDVHSARTSSGFGVNPITYSELLAWATLCRVPVSPWEIRVLRKMDSAWLAAFHEAQSHK